MLQGLGRQFLQKGPTKEELSRIKNGYKADLVRGLERVGGFGGKSDLLARNEVFGAYSAFGIGLLVGIQALLNIGVNTGLLPTKGLTLPLMSYGGSSILITLAMLAFVLRLEFENQKPMRYLAWMK